MSVVDLAAAPQSDFVKVTERTSNRAFRDLYHALRDNISTTLASLYVRAADPPRPTVGLVDRRDDQRPLPSPDGNPFQPPSMRTPGYSIFYRANDRARTDWGGLALSPAGLIGHVSIYKIPHLYVQRAGNDYSYEAFVQPADPPYLIGYARIV